jgi:hypothetical protein
MNVCPSQARRRQARGVLRKQRSMKANGAVSLVKARRGVAWKTRGIRWFEHAHFAPHYGTL